MLLDVECMHGVIVMTLHISLSTAQCCMIVDVVIVIVKGNARYAGRWLTSRYRGRSLFLICGVILNTDAPSHAFLDVVVCFS